VKSPPDDDGPPASLATSNTPFISTDSASYLNRAYLYQQSATGQPLMADRKNPHATDFTRPPERSPQPVPAYADTKHKQTVWSQSPFTNRKSPYVTYSNFSPPPRLHQQNPSPRRKDSYATYSHFAPPPRRAQPQHAHEASRPPGVAHLTAQGDFKNTKRDEEREAREKANNQLQADQVVESI
jgi:hypothetical protein